MTQVTNTSAERRIWPDLFDATEGHTLELGPGDSTDAKCWVQPTKTIGDQQVPDYTRPPVLADLAPDFEDPVLAVGASTPTKGGGADAVAPAGDAAPSGDGSGSQDAGQTTAEPPPASPPAASAAPAQE